MRPSGQPPIIIMLYARICATLKQRQTIIHRRRYVTGIGLGYQAPQGTSVLLNKSNISTSGHRMTHILCMHTDLPVAGLTARRQAYFTASSITTHRSLAEYCVQNVLCVSAASVVPCRAFSVKRNAGATPIMPPSSPYASHQHRYVIHIR